MFPRNADTIKERKDCVEQRDATPDNQLLPLDDVTLPVSYNSVTITLPMTLLEGEHINTEAPNSWRISALGEFTHSNFVWELNHLKNLHS